MENLENRFVYVGEGEEAQVFRGTLDVIGGIGGSVCYENPIDVAKRVNFPASSGYSGNDLFCRHLVFKILENFFIRRLKKYHQMHIPVPLGSYKYGYYYRFVIGSEGFPSEFLDDNLNRVLVNLEEENAFRNCFNDFGIDLGKDTLDSNDGSRKNIIAADYNIKKLYRTGRISTEWKRIDFGERSCLFDYDKFLEEMSKRKEEFKAMDCYALALLAGKYFANRGNISAGELRKLERQCRIFRKRKIKS